MTRRREAGPGAGDRQPVAGLRLHSNAAARRARSQVHVGPYARGAPSRFRLKAPLPAEGSAPG